MGNIHRLDGASRQGVREAVFVAAFTSVLFIVVYGGCSWLTSLRGKRPGLVVRDEVVSFLQTCTTRD